MGTFTIKYRKIALERGVIMISEPVTKILILEKTEVGETILRVALKGHPFKPIFANTTVLADQLLSKNPDIRIIAVTDCLADSETLVSGDILQWVAEKREKGFYVLAISPYSNCRQTLIGAGCDCGETRSRIVSILPAVSTR